MVLKSGLVWAWCAQVLQLHNGVVLVAFPERGILWWEFEQELMLFYLSLVHLSQLRREFELADDR